MKTQKTAQGETLIISDTIVDSISHLWDDDVTKSSVCEISYENETVALGIHGWDTRKLCVTIESPENMLHYFFNNQTEMMATIFGRQHIVLHTSAKHKDDRWYVRLFLSGMHTKTQDGDS